MQGCFRLYQTLFKPHRTLMFIFTRFYKHVTCVLLTYSRPLKPTVVFFSSSSNPADATSCWTLTIFHRDEHLKRTQNTFYIKFLKIARLWKRTFLCTRCKTQQCEKVCKVSWLRVITVAGRKGRPGAKDAILLSIKYKVSNRRHL